MNLKKRKIQSFIYMFLLMAYSGNPFFLRGTEVSQLVFVGIIILLLLKHHSFFLQEKSNLFYRYISLFVTVFSLQLFILGSISIQSLFFFILKIIFAYIIIRYLSNEFKSYYFKVLFLISLISLVGFVWNSMGNSIYSLIENDRLKSIFFYTQRDDGIRNSGMFWEPGAFAAYIIIGLLLHIGQLRSLYTSNPFKFIIVLLALITSFSTTGYLVLFLFAIATILIEFSKKSILIAIPLILLLTFIAFFTYERSTFLKDKIDHQYVTSMNRDQDEFAPSRMGAFLFDMHYIKKHPIIGNGTQEKTRYSDHKFLQGEKLGHGNGFSNFIASMGLLTLISYSFLIIRYNKKYPWIFLLIFFILLQGEQLLNFPIALSFPLIFYYEKYSRPVNML